MARGGGTGSRTNKKKKSADVVPQNGAVEVAGKPLKPTQANGDTEGSARVEMKGKGGKQTRKHKEETPPAPAVEEEAKEEKAKLVPTSEQLRLAQITQSQDNSADPQRKAKILQVMDVTGKTEDEVATALFDVGWDAARAVELLLEEGPGMGSWEETGKKKKKKNQEDEKAGKENEDWNDDFDPNNKFDDNRERSRSQRGPPRLRARGGGAARQGEEWRARESQENDRNNFEGGRGRGRGGVARGGRGGAVGGRGPVGSQRGGRGAGARGFSERGGLDSRVVERREPQPGAPGEPRQGEQGFGQIETWHPVGGGSPGGGAPAPGPVQQPGAPGAPGEGPPRPRPRPGSNKDAFDNAGNWGDDFPAAEDWDNDEYTGSLSDTKVFTPSGAAGTKPSAIGEPVNGEMRSGGPSLQAPGAAPTPANNSLSGSSYSQPIDISALLQKPGGLSGAPAALSQYQQAATKDLKSAIGLAPGQGSLSYSSASAAPPPSFASAAPGSAFSPIKPAAVTNGSSSASKALPRARLPPPSKIPSSAVEMPGDSLSNLDVQFGGLDLQFGGSNNDSNSSNFDFGAGTPPGQKQDLENERFSSIPPGAGNSESGGAPPPLDSYKSQGGQSSGAKEVPQSLSSALAAGIKQSSSTDSVPSYGRVGEREAGGAPRPDGKPAQYGGGQQQQRSPGPLLAKADNLGYNNGGSGYSGYQGGKASQGFPGSGYPGGFDRQPSGGYSAGSNGLSGSYGRGGGSSGYNPPREPSYSNSYGGGGGGGGGQAGGNFGSYGASTTNYSPYTANSSYSTSKSAAAAAAPSSQFAAVSTSSGSQYTESSAAGKAPYEGQQTSASSSYGGLGQSSAAATSASSLGLSASSSLGPSSSSKMSVNTASGKMVPGMPPGVPGVLPQQYLIGANAAAAGFPAYLANLGQGPAMAAAYGYGGVGGHQLEDLAALQRSTLAASLPQLVGSQPAAAAANQPTGGKAPNSGYYDPASQFGGNTGAAASLGSRAAEQPSSFPSDSSGKFGSTGDTTSSPVPSSVAQTQQPTPFNALASTFAAAAPQQHPTLPPGYAYFYGGVGGMGAQLAAAYGGGLPAAAGYPATHPGIPAPTVAGPTNTTQFQKQAYGSSYGNSYGDSLSLGQSNSYGKTSYGASADQPKSATGSNNTGHGYWSSTNGLW